MEMNAATYQYEVSRFLDKVATDSGREVVASQFTNIIREKLREDSFLHNFIPPEEVTMDNRFIQRSLDEQDESIYYLVYKEPTVSPGAAQYYSFQGTGESEYIYGRKVPIKIGKIGTRKFEKSEDELQQYAGIGLIELIEQNAAKELAKLQDKIFIDLIRNAVKSNGLDLSSGGVGINKQNWIDLWNAPLQVPVKPVVALMTETTYNNFFKQGVEVFGDAATSEIFMNGFKYKSLFGYPVVTTIKNDIVDDNEVFVFPAPEFLGKVVVLHDTKFTVKKEDEIVSWWCTKQWGIGIINTSTPARLRLNGFVD